MSSGEIFEDDAHVKRLQPPEVGTSEHRIYFYQQIKEGLDRVVEHQTTEYPNSPVAKGWRAMSATQQSDLLAYMLTMEYEPVKFNVEDKEDIHFSLTIGFSSHVLASMRKADKKPKTSLLRAAIYGSTAARQAQQ